MLCFFLFTSCSQNMEKNVDRPPAIMFQNSIYKICRDENKTSSFYENNLKYWGKIMDFTTENELPTKNFQATDKSLVGCAIYTSEEFPGYIFVMSIDEEGVKHYSPYEKNYS